jgi:hypothetical protein
LPSRNKNQKIRRLKLFAADDIGSHHPPAIQASLYLPHRENKDYERGRGLTIMSMLAD